MARRPPFGHRRRTPAEVLAAGGLPRLHPLLLLLTIPPLLFVLGQGAGGGTAERVGGVATAAVAMLAAIGAVRGSWDRDARTRQTWLLIAVGLAVWAIGRLVAVLLPTLPEDGPRAAALANAGYVAMVPLLGAGLLSLLPRARERAAGVKPTLDALIGLASLLTITWFFVLDPVWFDRALPIHAKLVASVHALGNVGLLMGVLVVGLRLGHRPISPSLGALAGGVLAFAVADTVAIRSWADGASGVGAGAEVAWIGAFVAIGLAALLERRTTSGTEGAADEADHEPLWRVILPYPLALALVALVAWQELASPLHGSSRWILITCLTVVAAIIVRQGLTVRDARTLTRTLSEQVDRDPLTGLINHRKVHERLAREMEHGREWGHPVAVALIDVDDFKRVNDRFGHQTGDQVLRTLANHLSAACRGTDVAARYAGDEFLLVLPGADAMAAQIVADRILRQVREAREGAGESAAEASVSLSIGVAVTQRFGRSAEQLVAIADAAMYDAKEAGKNGAVVVDADTLIAQPLPEPKPPAADAGHREAALSALVS